jgi:chromosome partitioning protein
MFRGSDVQLSSIEVLLVAPAAVESRSHSSGPTRSRSKTCDGLHILYKTHMLTISVVNQKGGCGKTTLATSLASVAHLAGLRTLLVDMDRQGSALDWSAARAEGSRLSGLVVVKADKALPLPRLREIARGYDVVVLDGPPRLGDVTRSACVACDVAVIPVRPGPFDLWAASETIELLDGADAIRFELSRGPVRRLFVVNLAQTGTVLARQAPSALEAHGQLAGIVHARIAFPEAAARGETVLTTEPDGPAAWEVGKVYKAVHNAHLVDAA